MISLQTGREATYKFMTIGPWFTGEPDALPTTVRELAQALMADNDIELTDGDELFWFGCNGEELLSVTIDGVVKINGTEVGTVQFDGPKPIVT